MRLILLLLLLGSSASAFVSSFGLRRRFGPMADTPTPQRLLQHTYYPPPRFHYYYTVGGAERSRELLFAAAVVVSSPRSHTTHCWWGTRLCGTSHTDDTDDCRRAKPIARVGEKDKDSRGWWRPPWVGGMPSPQTPPPPPSFSSSSTTDAGVLLFHKAANTTTNPPTNTTFDTDAAAALEKRRTKTAGNLDTAALAAAAAVLSTREDIVARGLSQQQQQQQHGSSSSSSTAQQHSTRSIMEVAASPWNRAAPPLSPTRTTRAAATSSSSSVSTRSREPAAWVDDPDSPPPPPPPLILRSTVKPDDALTVADLQAILWDNRHRWLQQQQFYDSKPGTTENSWSANPGALGRGSRSTAPATAANRVRGQQQMSPNPTSHRGGRGGVAFPQPHTLSSRYVQWGCTTFASMIGTLLAVSVMPNLWLMGAMAGAGVGYDTAQRRHFIKAKGKINDEDMNAAQLFILSTGRYLARLFLKAWDACSALFFMYKTGQLSYEYYKQYSALDQRFAIQKKVDAWNARFVQGKLAFDQWERENEVGRKLLAGLRTAWLVEERNSKRRSDLLKRRQSRYRIVQLLYDTAYSFRKGFQQVWTTGLSSPWSDSIRHLWKTGMSDMAWRTRSRGVGVALLVAITIQSVMCLPPVTFIVLSMIFGFLRPTVVLNRIDQTKFFHFAPALGQQNASTKGATKKNAPTRYDYFKTTDGKSLYFRRAGQGQKKPKNQRPGLSCLWGPGKAEHRLYKNSS